MKQLVPVTLALALAGCASAATTQPGSARVQVYLTEYMSSAQATKACANAPQGPKRTDCMKMVQTSPVSVFLQKAPQTEINAVQYCSTLSSEKHPIRVRDFQKCVIAQLPPSPAPNK